MGPRQPRQALRPRGDGLGRSLLRAARRIISIHRAAGSDIESVYIIASPNYSFLSSTGVKEYNVDMAATILTSLGLRRRNATVALPWA